jgi:hypothetical protein
LTFERRNTPDNDTALNQPSSYLVDRDTPEAHWSGSSMDDIWEKIQCETDIV